MGHKQPTLTTRGGPANRHGLWECTPSKALDWKCPACHMEIMARCWRCRDQIDIDDANGTTQEKIKGVWVYICRKCRGLEP
jgi:hypothetical protein